MDTILKDILKIFGVKKVDDEDIQVIKRILFKYKITWVDSTIARAMWIMLKPKLEKLVIKMSEGDDIVIVKMKKTTGEILEEN